MTWGTFHALALLFSVFATLGAVGFSPRRPTLARTSAALLAGLLSSSFSLALSLHMCDDGAPLAQWALPNLGVVALLALSRPSRLLRTAAPAALALGSALLSLHYASLVHEPGYIGRAQSASYDRFTIAPFWHSPLTGLYAKTPDTREGAGPAGPAFARN